MDHQRLIFHIDVNSAFLSWESVFRLKNDPNCLDLRTVPSVVGGDAKSRHGVVLAKSTPAKNMVSPPENPWHLLSENARICWWFRPVLTYISDIPAP